MFSPLSAMTTSPVAWLTGTAVAPTSALVAGAAGATVGAGAGAVPPQATNSADPVMPPLIKRKLRRLRRWTEGCFLSAGFMVISFDFKQIRLLDKPDVPKQTSSTVGIQ
jgi:hypothetical protein